MPEELRQISKIFIAGKISACLIIPIEIARRHGLEKPADVIVEERPNGILIRKLEPNNKDEMKTRSDIDHRCGS